MTGPELVIFGCLTPDNVVTAAGELLPQTFGGNCLYSALGARVWSDSVGVVSRYGAGYPEAAFDLLRDQGIATDGIRRLDVPHGRNVAFVYREDGSRTRQFPTEVIARIPEAERARFVDTSLLPDADDRWRQFAPDGGDVPEAWWAGVAAIHCAMMPVSKHRAIAATARERRGVSVWVQVDSPWHDHRAPSVDHATELFGAIDALLPSEADVEAFVPSEPVEAAVTAMLAIGARTIVLKLGASGCRVYESGRGLVASVPAAPVVARDPTGAGDAFCGGFLAGIRISGDVVTAARYGTVSASFAVEAHGLAGLINISRPEAARRLALLAG